MTAQKDTFRLGDQAGGDALAFWCALPFYVLGAILTEIGHGLQRAIPAAIRAAKGE